MRTSHDDVPVRVNRRVLSEPNRSGHRTLLAREGETITVAEAVRRGLTEADVTPVSRDRVDLASLLGGDRPAEFDTTVEDEASRTPPGAAVRSTDELIKRDGLEGAVTAHIPEAAKHLAELDEDTVGADGASVPGADDGTEVYPQHRHGPNWSLSDGTPFRGNREAAEAAQAELTRQLAEASTAAAPGEGDTENGGEDDTSGEDTGDGGDAGDGDGGS